MNLKVTSTTVFYGEVYNKDILIETLSQTFDENNRLIGGVNVCIINRDEYYKSIEWCRKFEDEFREKMRKIEDMTILEVKGNED